MKRVLFCTVGGSHVPLVTACEKIQPDHVYFICSQNRPGSKSSDSMILGQGNVIKKRFDDEKPTLPNIPAQLGYGEDRFSVLYVEPDDIDDVTQSVDEAMRRVREERDGVEMFADYTGGTKSMTAGLVLAALENNADLYLVKGQRTDLVKVCDGTQWGFPASVETVRFNRDLRRQLAAWEGFGYGQAWNGLRLMEQPRSSDLHHTLLRAMHLSQAFDAWDRFDHAAAMNLLAAYRPELMAANPRYIPFLDLLCSNRPAAEPARIMDLWLNAQRRAAQGRFDDATARVYRIIEWVAQWSLRREFEVDTSDLPKDFIPETVEVRPNRQGKLQAPLFVAWDLVKAKSGGPLGEFIRAGEKCLLTPLHIRNQSILAHGFTPIDRNAWSQIQDWFTTNLLSPLEQEAKLTGLKQMPEQLPQAYCFQV